MAEHRKRPTAAQMETAARKMGEAVRTLKLAGRTNDQIAAAARVYAEISDKIDEALARSGGRDG